MTTVRELLRAAGLCPIESVRWGIKPTITVPGVYLISTSEDPDEERGVHDAPIDVAGVRALLAVRPEAKVDGAPATETSVARRLERMWVPDEPVLYIGLAGTSVAKRVTQYHATRIGARGPHAGGWPLKMLRNLDQLWVHAAVSDDSGAAELAMLTAFADGCDSDARGRLQDPDLVLPYANLELTKGRRKRHGFSDVREPRSAKVGPSADPTTSGPGRVGAPMTARPLTTASPLLTQNVTAGDIANGRIRVPSRTKRALPSEKGRIIVELYGERMDARWDPRSGPDKERSGVIAIGKSETTRLLRPRAPLKVALRDGIVRIG